MANLFTMDSFGALDQSLEDLIMEKVKRQPAKPRQSVRRAVQEALLQPAHCVPPLFTTQIKAASKQKVLVAGGFGVWLRRVLTMVPRCDISFQTPKADKAAQRNKEKRAAKLKQVRGPSGGSSLAVRCTGIHQS